jgi:hypothetical protein
MVVLEPHCLERGVLIPILGSPPDGFGIRLGHGFPHLGANDRDVAVATGKSVSASEEFLFRAIGHS